jgi:hypothetical protein
VGPCGTSRRLVALSFLSAGVLKARLSRRVGVVRVLGDRTLRLKFEPLGFVGFGDQLGGTLMQSDMPITTQSPGRELKQQHFIVADGTAREWLAVQYEYRR